MVLVLLNPWPFDVAAALQMSFAIILRKEFLEVCAYLYRYTIINIDESANNKYIPTLMTLMAKKYAYMQHLNVLKIISM